MKILKIAIAHTCACKNTQMHDSIERYKTFLFYLGLLIMHRELLHMIP